MKYKKSLGQNFLQDSSVVEALIDAVAINPQDTVIEVGAGSGTVTKLLAKRAKRVVAVEFDAELIPQLEKNLASFDNIKIINLSILDLPLGESGANKIVGAIPYQITSPLIHKIIEENFTGRFLESVGLIVQKEVGEKITAQPLRASYLSNFVQTYASVRLHQIVPPTAFYPVPKVESAIISFHFDKKPSELDPFHWSSFLHRGFAHPRQMLNKAFPTELLQKAGLNPSQRPATLTVEEWQHLFAILNRQ